MSSDLHQGFTDVDQSAQPRMLHNFLELADSLPETRAYKRVIRSELALQPGETLLDIGCGVGLEACRIAR